jgi:hypothetical protein
MRIADDYLSFFGLLILPALIGKIVLRAIITGENIEALNGWASQAKKPEVYVCDQMFVYML